MSLNPQPADDGARHLLRHAVATLAYRAGKALRDAPPAFADHAIGPTTRTPRAILAHMGDLFDWALTMAQGQTVWHDATPQAWAAEVTRFFNAVTAFDAYLAGPAPIERAVLEKLLQGPVADALSHTGQLALMRRLVDAPVRGESYARAEIVAGRTGIEQAAPRWEFD
jgi:hypothetical protein